MPGAHHPGAEHADLGGLPGLDALRTQRAGVDRLQVEEERLDHVLRALVDDQVGQVARLDPRGGLEVDLRALDGGGQDRPLGRVVRALESACAAARGTPGGTPRARASSGCRRASCSPGASHGFWTDSGLALIQALAAGTSSSRVGDQLVDEPVLQRVGRAEAGALEQHVHQAVLDAEQADDAGDAAAAGQQAEARLGEPDLDLGVVDQDPVVAGQGDLVAAAERGAVDRGDDRLRERLEPAQAGLDPLGELEDGGRVVLGRLDHRVQVAAGEERLLRAGDHDARDRTASVPPRRTAGPRPRPWSRCRARSWCWRWPSGRRGSA